MVARTKRPAFHSIFLRSAQFSIQNGANGRKQNAFDLIVFVLVESRFPKARKPAQKLILQLVVWERTHDMNAWSINTIS